MRPLSTSMGRLSKHCPRTVAMRTWPWMLFGRTANCTDADQPASPAIAPVTPRKPHCFPSRLEGTEPMHYTLLGFTQQGSIRRFTFQRVAGTAERVRFVVCADLGLARKWNIA